MVKHDAPELLRKACCRHHGGSRAVLGLSGVTDAYQPFEHPWG